MKIKEFFKGCTKAQKIFFVFALFFVLTFDPNNLSIISKANCIAIPITLIAIIKNNISKEY